MPINFPDSPVLNDTYTYGNRVWKWNGTYWQGNGFSTLAVTSGGTGFSSYAVGDILYASSTTAWSKLAASTSGYILKSNGAAAPSWDALNVPTGSLQLYGGSAAPTGWLLCDGSAISRTTYATLFALISTNYGIGDGSSTFNIPDFRGRSPIGVGTGSGLTARALAATVGVESYALSSGELPSHNHTATDSGHTHTGTTGNQSADHNHTVTYGGGQIGRATYGFSAIGTGYQGLLIIRGSDTGSYVTSSGISANHQHSITAPSGNASFPSGTSSNGSGTAHNNMQPSLVVNYIIKT